MIETRNTKTQVSPLFPGTTGGPHTQLWMLLTANLSMVSLLTAIQPNITEQWRKCKLTYIANYQNHEFYICSKQCLVHLYTLVMSPWTRSKEIILTGFCSRCTEQTKIISNYITKTSTAVLRKESHSYLHMRIQLLVLQLNTLFTVRAFP